MKIFKLTLGLLLFSTLAYADFMPPTANYTADSYTKLLIHGDQADGTAGTDILDSETTPKTITAVANAQVDTAQYKNLTGSTGSILFDGTGDYLSLDDSDDWDFGTGDFTIDCWVRFNNVGINQVIVGNGGYGSGNTDGWNIIKSNGANLYFVNWSGAGVNIDLTYSWGACTTNTWYHLAYTRSGNNFNFYLDGTSVANITDSDSFSTTTNALRIGASWDATPTYFLDGWIDEFRISKGIARDFITTSGKQFIMITKFINNLNPDKIGTPMWSCKIKVMKWWKNFAWEFKV